MKYFILLTIFILNFFSLKSQNNNWNFVYSKDRLKVLKDTTIVKGFIEYIHGELDGDFHIHIRLDSIYNYMLNKVNMKKQNGCLVLEIICGKSSVFSICKGYTNQIEIPSIGDYVEVVGSYVFDKRHGHMEIHPVFDMNLLFRE